MDALHDFGGRLTSAGFDSSYGEGDNQGSDEVFSDGDRAGRQSTGRWRGWTPAN